MALVGEVPACVAGVLAFVGAVPACAAGPLLAGNAVDEAAGATVGFGSDALRSPVRTRSVAGGSAALPWYSARRRSSAAARPPDDTVCNAGMWLGSRGTLAGTRPVDDERRALRLRVVVVSKQPHMVCGVRPVARFKFGENALDRTLTEER